MNTSLEESGVWFVYDGECPMCTNAAKAIRIRKKYGAIHILNARTDNHPLIDQITQRNIDLDEGMVIYANDIFYHGKTALKFMARYGEGSNSFTAFCKTLFWSDTIAAITYPWMRGTRNFLLKRKNAPRIDNLNL